MVHPKGQGAGLARDQTSLLRHSGSRGDGADVTKERIGGAFGDGTEALLHPALVCSPPRYFGMVSTFSFPAVMLLELEPPEVVG